MTVFKTVAYANSATSASVKLHEQIVMAEAEGVEPPEPVKSSAAFKAVERADAQRFHEVCLVGHTFSKSTQIIESCEKISGHIPGGLILRFWLPFFIFQAQLDFCQLEL